MKIAQIIFTLNSGGAERFVVNLSNELARQGHDVTLITLRDDKIQGFDFNRQFLNDNVKYHNMRFRQAGFSLSMAKTVNRYFETIKPDIVHCHLITLPYLTTYLLHGNRNIVHTLHNIASKTADYKITVKIFRQLYKSQRVTPVVISDECNKSFTQYFSLPTTNKIINGGTPVVQSPLFKEVKDEIASINPNGVPVFIHVGRFNKSKNQKLLIDSFNRLNAEKVPFKLLIIGRGFEGEKAKQMKESACENIFFLGEKSNVADYLLNADAFCLSSDYEGLPISLLEALSAGITPICTAVGGIPSVVKDGETGYLAEEPTVDSYTDAIHRFIARPINAESLKKHFLENFSIEICANQYLQIYQSKVKK